MECLHPPIPWVKGQIPSGCSAAIACVASLAVFALPCLRVWLRESSVGCMFVQSVGQKVQGASSRASGVGSSMGCPNEPKLRPGPGAVDGGHRVLTTRCGSRLSRECRPEGHGGGRGRASPRLGGWPPPRLTWGVYVASSDDAIRNHNFLYVELDPGDGWGEVNGISTPQ